MKFLFCLSLLLAPLSCIHEMGSVDAMDHIVGGSYGWLIPPNKTFYQDWAKPRTFAAGDRLVFMYRTSVHMINQVSEKDFNACTDRDRTIQMLIKGPSIIQLNKTGDYYYYCGVGKHCEMGEKLSITVGEAPGSAGVTPDFSDIIVPPTLAPALAPSPSPSPSSAHTISVSNFSRGALSAVAFLINFIVHKIYN